MLECSKGEIPNSFPPVLCRRVVQLAITHPKHHSALHFHPPQKPWVEIYPCYKKQAALCPLGLLFPIPFGHCHILLLFSIILMSDFPHSARSFGNWELTWSTGIQWHGTRSSHLTGPKATNLRDWDRPQLIYKYVQRQVMTWLMSQSCSATNTDWSAL